ncbi:thrombomodulin-like [Trachinotus anak]|uniref:thrombomodulin-like n=1 Tax=Trachinotus anak TaxID=443729 RepID=UPI0039F1DF63
MTPTTRALLICAVFLCGLEEALLSQLGHCAGNKCLVLLQERKDFSDAKKSCEHMSAKLLPIGEEKSMTLESLLSTVNGSFWLTGGTSEGSAPGLQLCPSAPASSGGKFTVQWMQCRDKLDGALCLYTDEAPCAGLKTSGGAQLKYITYWDFEVKDLEAFPQGTTAVAEKMGGQYPESKHVCFSGKWIPAPWQCEVLRGGCEHECSPIHHTCTCPKGQTLHPNGVSCIKAAEGCQQEGQANVCQCRPGYELAPDGKHCVDVDECKGKDKCTGEGEKCLNTPGGYECSCQDEFEMHDGVCVSDICFKCEHDCNIHNGVPQCSCRKGFRVSAEDPTRCETHCTTRHCPAECDRNTEAQSKDMKQCRCPDGYISHLENDTNICTDIDECADEKQCDHECENFFGGYRCVCNDGYTLHDDHTCVPDDWMESSSPPHHPTPAIASPAAVPSYIKTGSVLGISVFVLLCAALLCCLARHMVKRCGKFKLSSFTSPDIDIFYLQQVTTETYKRLSFDKQFKNDAQRQ